MKDYANKPKTRKSKPAPRRTLPGWVWMLTGTVTGLFIAFLFYLAKLAPDAQHYAAEQQALLDKLNQQASQQTPQESAPDKAEESSGHKPQFEFFTLLPKIEVITPEHEDPAAPRESSNPKTAHQYLLQAGSFQRMEDADTRRAELILMGMDANIQKVAIRPGEYWHRVMVGPFDNINAMHRAQDKLTANGIESLTIQLR